MKIKLGAGALTMANVYDCIGGKCIGDSDISFEYICTDSREAGENTLFVAFKGEKVDGHNYISSAYDCGCRCFLVECANNVPADASAVMVSDSNQALMEIASEYKSRVNCTRIGITGSVGKTTTKEFVASVVSQKYRTHKTFGNYNSTIGMPLTLMETPERTGASVLEMAMSGLGEISRMSRIARPDIAIISNIGSSHMEALGSKDNILKAKLEILEGLSPDGCVIINADDDMLVKQHYDCNKVIGVGIKNERADYLAYNIRTCARSTVFDVRCNDFELHDIKIPIIGEHNVYAALIAIAVGGIMCIDEESIRQGLDAYMNVGFRQNIVDIGGVTVIEDCYNASPESMRAAIKVLSSLKKTNGRTIALLGDMLELGEMSKQFHCDVGKFVAEYNVDMLFTIGPSAVDIAESAVLGGMKAENVFVNSDAQNHKKSADDLWNKIEAEDVLLVKASRGIQAEKVIRHLREFALSDSQR